MIRSKQWCIQQRPEGGYFTTQVLSRTKDTVTFAGVVETKTLDTTYKGAVYYTFTPEDYHLYTDTFPKLKPELLALQIKKRFTDLGIAMDTTSLLHKSSTLPGKGNSINSVFIHEEDLINNLPQISSLTGIKTCQMVPTAVAIAGLIRTVTDKAVLIFLIGLRFSQVLVVKNGIPIYNQSLAQTSDGQVEEALIPNAVDFARVTLRKDHGIDDFNILCLGQGRKTIDLKNLDIEEWQPDFSKAIKTPEQTDILRYPHLFGAYFANSDYNFIPKDFAKIWQVQSITRMAAIVAGIAAVTLLAGWLYYQPLIKEQRNTYQTITTELELQRGAIADRMPQNTILNNFERLVNIRTKAQEDFRLDTLAKQLSEALPQKVRITELKLQRQALAEVETLSMPSQAEPVPGDSETPGTSEELSIPEKIQTKGFTLSLTCISEGSYTEVTTRFEKTALALNETFGVTDLTWNYRETDRTGIIHCNLFPQPGGQTNES
ncbi:MAG: hypothetical protein ACI8ZB_003228 [Desulforhopalus sp.]|jgi:hypothetical protein